MSSRNHRDPNDESYDIEREASRNAPPEFKVRNTDYEAMEGNYDWEVESIDSGQALTIVADVLGPETMADVLGRYWQHSGQPLNLMIMARHLAGLAKRFSKS